MANKGTETFSYPSIDVPAVAGASKTAGDVDVVTGGGVVLWMTTTANGATGTVRVFGTASMTVADGLNIDIGDLVYWNASTGVTVTNTDTPLGISLQSKVASSGVTQHQVLINTFES